MGDIYFGFDFSTQFAYFLTNQRRHRRHLQLVRQQRRRQRRLRRREPGGRRSGARPSASARRRSIRRGNGAPGYGTTTPPDAVHRDRGRAPRPSSAAPAGTRSRTPRQITDNDVIPWSDRGPGATGSAGVDVVGDGAFSPGDLTLNDVLDGHGAWATWGGTSRSTPVVVGRHRPRLPGPAEARADRRRLRAAGQGDPEVVGPRPRLRLASPRARARSQAGEAVKATLGRRSRRRRPTSGDPATTAATTFAAFPHLLPPGAATNQTFKLDGRGTLPDLRPLLQPRVASTTFHWTSPTSPRRARTRFNAPDYLIDLTDLVKAHPSADLMVDPGDLPALPSSTRTRDYANDQRWTLLAYDWTDINHDGRLWTDKNHDGVVNHTDSAQTDIDGDPLIDFTQLRDRAGRVRAVHATSGPVQRRLQSMVRDPAAADGQRPVPRPATSRARAWPSRSTHFTFEIDFYKNVDWALGHHAATATRVVHGPDPPSRRARRPACTRAPSSSAAARPAERRAGRRSTVAGEGARRTPTARSPAASTFGGAAVAAAQTQPALQQRLGLRRQRLELARRVGRLAVLLLRRPDGAARGHAVPGRHDLGRPGAVHRPRHADLRAVRRTPTSCCRRHRPDRRAVRPRHGRARARTRTSAPGVWTFNTATGGAEDVVAAPAAEGLHALVEHEVSCPGRQVQRAVHDHRRQRRRCRPPRVDSTRPADTGRST